MKLFIVILNFFLFYILNITENKEFKYFISLIFLVFSFFLFFLIDFSKLPDYQQYYNVIGIRDSEISIKTLFTEPYYFELVNVFNKRYSSEISIRIFYFINTFITTFFFIWISFNKKAAPWKNVLLYSLFYYLFSFILLRNTPSYILTGILFYFLQKNIFVKTTILSFLCHLSSLPVLFFSFFKNKKADFKLLIIVVIYFLVFNLLTQLEIFGIYNKLTIYQDDKEYGQNIFHKLYFILFLIFNLYMYLKYKSIIDNYTYILIFFTYLILQSIGPVMAYRFSIYIILYIFLSDKFSPKKNDNTLLNFVSLSFIILAFLNYNQLLQ